MKNTNAKIRVNYNLFGVNTFKSAKNKHLKSNDLLLTSTNYYNSMRIVKSCNNTLYIKINGEYIKLKDYRIQLKKAHHKYYITPVNRHTNKMFIIDLATMESHQIIETNKMVIEGHARDKKLADKLNNK